MKKINILSIAFILAIVGGMFTACSDFDPKGMPQVPELRKASDLKATIDGFVVNLSWDLPAADDIEGVDLITNGVNSTAVKLEGKCHDIHRNRPAYGRGLSLHRKSALRRRLCFRRRFYKC